MLPVFTWPKMSRWTEVEKFLSRGKPWESRTGASELILCMGPLAGWLLRPEILALGRQDTTIDQQTRDRWKPNTVLDREPGGCWVVFFHNGNGHSEVFRPAFVLPFRWQKDKAHSCLLPQGVRDIADQILHDLNPFLPEEQKQWGLQPGAAISDCDLSTMSLSCRSGWAPLAAGLLLAAEGQSTSQEIWATGRWNNGVDTVDGLKEKIELAQEYGAKSIFVPPKQKDEAEQVLRQNPAWTIKIEAFDAKNSYRDALKPYLFKLKIRPDRDDDVEIQTQYYLSPDLDEISAKDFYLDILLPKISEECKKKTVGDYPSDLRALVTIFSDSPELVGLAIDVFRPERCLALGTKDKHEEFKKIIDQTKNRCEQNNRDLVDHWFHDLDELRDKTKEVVQQFISQFKPEQILFDLTPGPKDISLGFLLEIAPPGSYFCYFQHRMKPKTRRVIPFSAQPKLLRKSAEAHGIEVL